MIVSRIEIGFDLSGNPDLDNFVLDDDTRGVLDNATYTLGGVAFYDVSDKVVSFSINRGKSRYLDRYPSGQLEITLNNNDRSFDPIFAGSPYAGQIIPRREVRVYSNDIVQMEAVIDDWNLNYSPNGNSTASIIASDGMARFANQTLNAKTYDSEYAGERIIEVLNDPQVNWSTEKRNIETGRQLLQGDSVETGTNALEYLQLIEKSEPGSFFIARNGYATFKDVFAESSNTELVTLTDNGEGIPYQSINVVYGSELLYNEVVVNIAGGGSASANNPDSQIDYGISNLTLDGLLLSDTDQAQLMADILVSKYDEPEYRIQSVSINLNAIPEADAEKLLALDMGSVCKIEFTPNNLPPTIERYGEVISIQHSVAPLSHVVTLGFAALDLNFWRLDDLVFSRLSSGNALAY